MILYRPWLAICALVGACAATPPAPSAPPAKPAAAASLAGTRWIAAVEGVSDERQLPRIEFLGGGRINGYTGCNMFSGTWREEGGSVRFGAIAATKRMCLGPGHEVEKRVLAALGEGSRAVREGDRLVLDAPGGGRFEFVAAT